MTVIRDDFISINYVPTHVVTWGGWLDDPAKATWKEMIVMFTGNPGVTAYYSELLGHLHQKLQIPVWVISMAGHELPFQGRLMPKLETNRHLFNLEGQIQGKKEFFRQYVPKNCKVHLLGHSVGAYMALEMLKEDEFADKVKMSYMLFPALENIAATPNGRFFTKLVTKFLWLVYLLAGFFNSLPHFLGMCLLSIYFRLYGTETSPAVMDATMQLIHPRVLRSVFFLAEDEMDNIKELDVETIKKRKEKLMFYYGDHDNWAPLAHYENLVKAVPDVNAKVCTKGSDHAFMLHKPSHILGEVMVELIQKNRES